MAPSPSLLASVCKTKGLVKSGQAKTGAWVRRSFSSSNALYWSSPHTHFIFFLSNLFNGEASADAFGTNRRYHETSPTNRLNSRTLVGAVRTAIAAVFSGSVWIPSTSIPCPRYRRRLCPNWHLSQLGFSFASLNLRKPSHVSRTCSSKEDVTIMMSSR